MTNVYFAEAVGLQLVKIGRTDNVEKRMGELRAVCPVPLKLLAVLPGASPVRETLIHQRFSECREHGEWFRLTLKLWEYIDAIPDIRETLSGKRRKGCANSKDINTK